MIVPILIMGDTNTLNLVNILIQESFFKLTSTVIFKFFISCNFPHQPYDKKIPS